MWTRDQYFPASYAHATWARLAPFFQLPGPYLYQHTVSVQLRPFNDRQYNRDLSLLCQRVNEKQLHLPDGRLLLLSCRRWLVPFYISRTDSMPDTLLNRIEPKWVHGKRAIVEPARLLTASELRQRVCDYFDCEQVGLLTQKIA